MKHQSLYIPPERDEKGWSYSFVYHLKDLRNIYNIYCNTSGIKSMSQLLAYCKNNDIKSESGKAWTTRSLLEIVNALVNFGLLTNNKRPTDIRFNSTLEDNLSIHDKDILINIFFSYFRFSQYLPIFGGISENKVAFAYMDGQRFFNRFICTKESIIYELDGSLPIRFWDVFTKWGTTLGILNKCKVEAFGIDLGELEEKNALWIQLTKPIPQNFSILQFMEENIPERCVYIPYLIYKIIEKYAYPIELIKEKLIEECSNNLDNYRLQTITEIFIMRGEKTLFPLQNDNYKSHILKLN